jgi:hypothetical protein
MRPAFCPFVKSNVWTAPASPEASLGASLLSLPVVQFVRSLSPSTSYAPAVVLLASNYGWSRVCLLASDFGATVASWSSALVAKNVNVFKERIDTFSSDILQSISAVLSAIADQRLRVVFVLATPEYVQKVAVAADSLQLINSGWAWISDSTVEKIDFAGDAPDVRERASQLF